MERSDINVLALSVCVVSGLLAGCAGAQPPIGSGSAGFNDGGTIRKAAIVETVIHSFSGANGSTHDGANPRAGLINVNGTLYGTTYIGGSHNDRSDMDGHGSVFSTTTSGVETVIHRFNRADDGRNPYAGLLGFRGILYGTTQGGPGRLGTVFSISRTGTEKVLLIFNSLDGGGPQAGLINVNGTLYGTTQAGGAGNCDGDGCGTVFKITPGGKESVIHSFGLREDGSSPLAGLIDLNGTLYGTTADGGTKDSGVVFAVKPSGKETVLHNFTGGASDGAEPWAGLVNVNGTLYGTTFNGGVNRDCKGSAGCGTVFSITPSGTEKLLHRFGGSADGVDPEAGLLNVNGTLYGTTYAGGSRGYGTVFSITTSGKESVLYAFATNGPYDGAAPEAGLIDINGTLYGTTVYGGTSGDGTVYSLTGF